MDITYGHYLWTLLMDITNGHLLPMGRFSMVSFAISIARVNRVDLDFSTFHNAHHPITFYHRYSPFFKLNYTLHYLSIYTLINNLAHMKFTHRNLCFIFIRK
jgi:hypothetical protein